MTERACLPEPPWDVLIETVSPVSFFQCPAKAAFTSL
jgi:hypothetical protein